MVAGAGGIAFALATRGVLPDRLESTLVAGGLVLGLWALWLWLRPLSEHVLQSIEERRLVRELVGSYGNDSLAFFALRHDKSYFFSASGRAFLAYRVLGAIALVSGDPVGDEDDFASLLGEFAHYVHRSGWRVALLGVSRRHLGLYRRLDLRPIKLGEEAVLRPEHFSLEGRAIRKVRQAWQHLERAGCSFAVSAADALSPEKRREIEAISQAWLDGKPERGFSMTIDDLFTPETILAVCLDPSGKPLGFLHLVPCAGGRCYSLSTMRRLPEAPNGATEFLVVETLAWARRHGVEELSLNFCAFRSLLAEEGREIPRRAARRLLLTFDGVFQLERLHLFSRKFLPEWRPRYVCVERIGDVPAVGIAYLRAESLIAPPRRRLRRRSPVAG
jgi:lysyl-tRNA synthetase class 2